MEGEYKEACQFRDEARAETRTMEISLQAESKERQAIYCAALYSTALKGEVDAGGQARHEGEERHVQVCGLLAHGQRRKAPPS